MSDWACCCQKHWPRYVLWWSADCESHLVVLLLQVAGVYRHSILRPAQEERPDIVLARLPPRHDVSNLVDRCQVGAWWPGWVMVFLCHLSEITTRTCLTFCTCVDDSVIFKLGRNIVCLREIPHIGTLYSYKVKVTSSTCLAMIDALTSLTDSCAVYR